MANFVGELAERPLRAHRRKLENMVINQYGDTLDAGELLELAGSDQFQRLDLKPAPFKDGRGVSRDAFCLVMPYPYPDPYPDPYPYPYPYPYPFPYPYP
jgi:hypothetical protein